MGVKETKTNSPAPASHAILEVVDGVHRGASLSLDRAVYGIGSAPNADIVLGDSGVAPEHGIIRLQGRTSVAVEAIGGDVGIGKRLRIPQGHGCSTKLPVELELGDAVLRIDGLDVGRPGLNRRTASRLAAVGGSCCILLALTSGVGMEAGLTRLSLADSLSTIDAPVRAVGELITGSINESPSNEPPAAAALRVPTSGPAELPRVPPAMVAETLKAKLQDANLSDMSLQIDGTRMIVSGTIAEDERGAWSDIHRWFDRTYSGHYVLTSAINTRMAMSKPEFDLQAISFGENPYVITSDGQRRYTGAHLDKGWVIKEIRAGRLTLTKDGRELALNF